MTDLEISSLPGANEGRPAAAEKKNKLLTAVQSIKSKKQLAQGQLCVCAYMAAGEARLRM